MMWANTFFDFPFIRLFESLLADFILAFAFFTALAYAIVSKRFDHQKSAIAMSSALGLALAVGLVWWEHDRGLSIRDLGPIAVGFAVILLAMVMFGGISQTGGTWAGAGIALGASLLVGWVLGADWLIPTGVVQALAVVALTVGVMAFLLHSHGVVQPRYSYKAVSKGNESAGLRHDMSDLYNDRRMGQGLANRFSHLRQETGELSQHPQEIRTVYTQLQQMLPAEGWLTERLAQLRTRAHYMRKGHLHRIEELKNNIQKLPAASYKQAKRELAERYHQLHLDKRLERLDEAAAEYERRIRQVTKDAQEALARSDYRKLNELLVSAGKLQTHNDKLFKTIERTENKLSHLAKQVEKEAREVAGK